MLREAGFQGGFEHAGGSHTLPSLGAPGGGGLAPDLASSLEPSGLERSSLTSAPPPFCTPLGPACPPLCPRALPGAPPLARLPSARTLLLAGLQVTARPASCWALVTLSSVVFPWPPGVSPGAPKPCEGADPLGLFLPMFPALPPPPSPDRAREYSSGPHIKQQTVWGALFIVIDGPTAPERPGHAGG